jgi:hypothetical protein
LREQNSKWDANINEFISDKKRSLSPWGRGKGEGGSSIMQQIFVQKKMMICKNIIHRTSILLILGSLLLFFYLPGCKNPFKTRKSPQPIVWEGTWDTPSDPKIVIQNLLYAYNEKIIGNFILCLCDSFRFSAPEDSIKAVQDNREELFANWDRSTEINVTNSIFTTFRQNVDSISYVLSFDPSPPVPDDVSDTVAVLSRDYLFIFNFKSAPPETATGTATFHMRQTWNWWSIYFWSDIPDVSGGDDWGDFKAEFRQSPL